MLSSESKPKRSDHKPTFPDVGKYNTPTPTIERKNYYYRKNRRRIGSEATAAPTRIGTGPPFRRLTPPGTGHVYWHIVAIMSDEINIPIENDNEDNKKKELEVAEIMCGITKQKYVS